MGGRSSKARQPAQNACSADPITQATRFHTLQNQRETMRQDIQSVDRLLSTASSSNHGHSHDIKQAGQTVQGGESSRAEQNSIAQDHQDHSLVKNGRPERETAGDTAEDMQRKG